MIGDWWSYLTDPDNWDGRNGLWANIVEHVTYSGIAVGVALLIAFPLGLWIGHTGRGATLVVGTVNASRALPTFGLMVLLFILISPHFTGKTDLPYILPVEIVLLLLAVPPILSNTYAGLQSVDPAVRDAARGMGMTGGQVLRQVELPNAYPLIMSGLRSAALQVIATATVGAYIGLGGLGAPIYDATQQGPFQDTESSHLATGELLTGAFLVAALALLIDLVLATIQRYTTSRGITGRYRSSSDLVAPSEVAVRAAEGRTDLAPGGQQVAAL
ncbi:ABC transporter permease [Nakamurella endophytica]|uniref:Glycine/betaine ABC transporter permease n=1 Tax=Nakamurella endophytica TaxID=1748367 RepID=A0A917WH41_9ACTN|nr:ABC transporter permease [Nakamurella endophytica]GGM03644.1 glycine/betaine ABC transporter permease [Nakamurella endophytica]